MTRTRHYPVIIASAVAASAVASAVALTPPVASASTSGEPAFCSAFARFGDSSSYRNLVTVHADAGGADHVTRAAYYRFQAALLSGAPRAALRTDLAAVYAACRGARPAASATAAHGWHRIGNSPLYWHYVSKAEMRDLHIGPRSVMIAGPRQTTIVSQAGSPVAAS